LPPSSNRRNSNSSPPVKGQRSNQKGLRKLSSTKGSTGTQQDRRALSGKGGKGGKGGKMPRDNFLQKIYMDKDFSDLTELIIRAALAGALESGGPFTLFAPTNNAFANLPEGTNKLLFEKDAFRPHLFAFLFNHLIGGTVLSSDLFDGLVVNSFAGEPLQFNIDSLTGDFFVNGIFLSDLDQLVTNGVLHEINDFALAPSWVFASLTGRTAQIGITSLFLLLLQISGLDVTYNSGGEFTFLAPTDAAFGRLSTATQNCLVDPLNILALQDVLNFHVLKGVLVAADFEAGKDYKTVEKGKVKVTSLDPLQLEGGVNFIATDILANNGVVHLIDQVLDPGSICIFS
jgi:transforming growth factor-beta-induced protein